MNRLLNAALLCSLLTSAPALAEKKAGKHAKPDLTGSWASPACESVPNGQGGTMNFTRTFTITPARWSIDFVVFGDAACSEGAKLFTASYAGPYRLLGPSATVPGATEAEFDFAERKVLPNSEGGAGYFNGQKVCGAADWKVGQARDIQQSGCAQLGAWPLAQCAGEHDVVQVKGDALYFGDRPADQNLCSKEKRPKALGKTPVQRRK
jgi:hypothetical protein